MKLTVVAGFGPWAVEVGLRHVGRHVDPRDAIAVLDGRGTGARVAPPKVIRCLTASSVAWFDVSDRRRPVALFGVPAGSSRRGCLTATLADVLRLRGLSCDERAATVLAHAADRAAGSDGLVTLGTLLEVAQVVRGATTGSERESADAEAALREALAWALRFSAVHNLSEGPHRVRLDELLAKPGVRWFELPLAGFEPLEHAVAAALCRSALENAFESSAAAARARGGRLVLLDLCPTWSGRSAVERWLAAGPPESKCITTVHVDPRRGVAVADRRLFASAEHVMLVGLPQPVSVSDLPGVPGAWGDLLGRLRRGQVAVVTPDAGSALTVRLDYGASSAREASAEPLRWRSALARPLSSSRQVSEGVPPAGRLVGPSDRLFERVTAPEGLRTGWFHVRRTGATATGIDGVTITSFGAALPEALARLSEELRQGAYRPLPLRRIYFPKPDGGRRAIGIPAVRDRVAQAAVLHHLEPLWEPHFSPYSFAFRPRRGAHDALALAQEYAAAGLTWTVSADVEKCFDHVDHEILLQRIHERVSDARVLRLVRSWAENEVIELGEVFGSDIGVPQGSVLSPFLANIYLHPLDEALARAGLRFLRYADDLLVFSASAEDAKRALDLLEATLGERLAMRLKPTKTRLASLERGVRFLGFDLFPATRRIAAEALDRVRERLDVLLSVLSAEARPSPTAARVMDELDAVVAGWRGYFGERLTPEVAGQLAALDADVDGRAAGLPRWLSASSRWARRVRFFEPAPPERDAPPTGTYPEPQGPAPAPPPVAHPGAAGSKGCVSDARSVPGASAGGEVGTGEADDEAAAQAAVALIDGRLMVLAHGAYLGVDGDALVVRRRREELGRASLSAVALVLMDGLRQRVGTDAQVACADRGIPIVLIGAGGRPVGVFEPVMSRRAALRAQQVIQRDEPLVIAAGLEMLSAKVANQAALLKYFAKYQRRIGSPTALALTGAAADIQEAARRIAALDGTTPALRAVAMGHEGQGAAAYWSGFAKLMPAELDFPGRRTRGATDRANQCLNYVYGVLYGEVWQAVVSYGLDPYFGVMHGSTQDSGSLVFDLVEELRAPFADRTVAALVGRGFVPRMDRYGGLLASTRRTLAAAFLRAFTRRRVRRGGRRETGQAILRAQVRSVAAMYRERGRYRGYRMQW